MYIQLPFGAKRNYEGLGYSCMVHEVRRLRCGFSAKDRSELLKSCLAGFLVDIWVLSPNLYVSSGVVSLQRVLTM